MSISLVGVATGTTTCTVPAHQIGDLIVIFAFRTNTSAPALPSGYVSILTKSGTSSSGRLGFKIATATNDSSGTWTNAGHITCHVYRCSTYATGGSLFPGGSASNSSTNSTVNYPALTMVHSDGTSWAAGFVGCSNTTQTVSTAPSGMTNQSSVSATTQVAGHDTNGAVSSWSSTNVVTTGTAGNTVSCTLEIQECVAGVASISNIVQSVSTSYNAPVSNGETGNNFVFNLPNPVRSGNAILMAVTYPSGTAVNSITDDKSNSWSTTAIGTSDPGGGQAIKAYLLTNATADTQAITIGFPSAVQPVKFWFYELYNVTGTVNGTANAVNQGGSTGIVSPGSMTPTNNNSNGGNLIFSFMGQGYGSGGTNPFRIWAASGYSLNDADIGWNSGQAMPTASQYYLQATSAATVSSFTVANNVSTDTYNVLAVALSIGTQGTAKPAGVHIDKVSYFSSNGVTATALPLQIPMTGNCMVISNFLPITSVSDSDGTSWTTYQPGGAGTNVFMVGANLTQNPGRTLSVTWGGTGNMQCICYDISGAATSPVGTTAGTGSTGANNVSSISHQPDITPSVGTSLVITYMSNGLGPSFSVTSPTGAIFDLPNYTGNGDSGNMAWGNCAGHLYSAGTSSLNWAWTFTNQTSNSVSAMAIEIKAAVVSGIVNRVFNVSQSLERASYW